MPNQILRSINRVAALLETVDLEFERALSERDLYARETDESIRSGNSAVSDEALNVEVLRRILDEKLPEKNQLEGQDYAGLLDELHALKIVLVRDLIGLIDENLRAAQEFEQRAVAVFARQRRKEGGMTSFELDGISFKSGGSRLHLGVLFTHRGLIRVMLWKAGLREKPTSFIGSGK